MLKQIMTRFFPAKRLMLGRWCLNDKTKNLWKIDMANIDHCGTCALSEDKKNDEQKHKKEHGYLKAK